ncbi:MAG: hypothetical protein ACLFOY_00220 [Desulfatibacillaceae bacterium]
MARNFRIGRKSKKADLYLDLQGDFDGTSAHMLLDCIEKNRSKYRRVYVNTESLGRVAPFGQDLFAKKARVAFGPRNGIRFIGENAHRFS